MPDIDLILALTPMLLFFAGVLWASALIAPTKTTKKEDQ